MLMLGGGYTSKYDSGQRLILIIGIWQSLFNLKKANLLVGTEESGGIQGLPPEHFSNQ